MSYIITTYEIIQLVPVTGYCAVYAFDAEDGSGGLVLGVKPIAALALAKVEEKVCHSPGVCSPARRIPNEIVGVELSEDGSFEICQESCNFAGLCREGEDFSECYAYLAPDMIDRLQETPGELQEAGEPPRWMDRPSGPGMWVIVDDDKRFPDVAINLTQEQIDSGAPFASKRVFGPIPKDK
jgi:hypothetical protein